MTGVSVLCAVLVLLAIGWLVRLGQGQWLAPGPLFCAYWAAGVGFPALLAPSFTESVSAVWYIVVLVAAFALGSWIASRNQPPVRQSEIQPRQLNLRLLRLVVVAGTVAGVAAVALAQRANGASLSSVLSLQGLFEGASSLSYARYTNAYDTPAAVPLLLAVNYAAALIGPFAARGIGRRLGALCVIGPFLGATFYAAVTTQRAGMFTAIFLLVAGWIGSRVYFTGDTPRIGLRRAIGGLLGAAVALAAFFGIGLLRTGGTSTHFIQIATRNLAVYAFGYMPGFSHWFTTESPTWPDTWGSASLAGISKYVGFGAQYNDALQDWAPLGNGGETNIYSAWRYLITDFGIALSPIAALLIGFLVTVAWRRLSEWPTTITLIGCLAGYAYMLYSVTLPIFTFTNVTVAVVLAGVALSRQPRPPVPVRESPHEAAVRRARENLVRATG